ncbi:MAG: phosphoribosylanthranilate isomerase [bacterium]
MNTLVKICCISTCEEAKLAIQYGASAIGLVSAMPSGPGPIDEALITKIAATIPPGVSTFLLTSQQDAAAIIRQQHRTRVNTVQLVDAVSIETLNILREELPGVSLVQVIHVLGEDSIREAECIAPYVNALLLDSGNPNLAVKELGGTGRTHNWGISRTICATVHVPMFLAGGLKPSNIREAIETVRPFGVDVCSGVRTDNRLDEQKLAEFMNQVTGTK